MRDHLLRVIAMLAVAACAAGCSPLQARTPGPSPALNTPPAPAPIVIPVTLESEPAPAPEPPPTAAATNTPRDPVPPPVRPPRPSAPATPPVTATTPPAEPAAAPQPTLQTAPDATAAEIRTNITLSTAEQNLDRVVYTRLGAEARAQFDNARGLIRMAKNYLKLKNYMYAEQLADKAAAVANLLIKY